MDSPVGNQNGHPEATLHRVISFNAGPTKVSAEVKERVAVGVMNYAESGISMLEVGHRSSEFVELMKNCELRIRRLLNVPKNYHVLFMQGGANGQFDAIPMNLFGNRGSLKADYLVSGSWSQKAAKEAKKYGKIREICPQIPGFTELPPSSTWKFDPEAAYFYYCDNETVNGLQFPDIPQPPSGVPIVCDMCSSLLSRPVDISRYGLVYAGSQKNMGGAGLTVVIIRDDLVGQELPFTPSVLNYRMQVAANSVLNTPPTFSAFVINETLRWVEEQGGLLVMSRRMHEKSTAVYKLIDQSNGFYRCVAPTGQRSCVNVVLRLSNVDLENLLLSEAKAHGLIGLNGHRSVGGLRISLYNAITTEDVRRLLSFMDGFMTQHLV